jgi:hypothetical protein
MSDSPDNSEKKTIALGNGRSAQILPIQQPQEASKILEALNNQKAKAAILVCGSTPRFRPRLKNRLLDLVSRGVAQAALNKEAIIIDTGSKAGVGELVGHCVPAGGLNTTLIGVVPNWKMGGPEEPVASGAEPLDGNHTHFVVTETEQAGWQTEVMCQLAEAVTETGPNDRQRILTLLLGGEGKGSALDTSLETVRRGWPFLVVEGSGPLANKIVRLKKYQQNAAKRAGGFWKWVDSIPWLNQLTRLKGTNPRLFEIISDGDIRIIQKETDAEQLRKMIEGLFTDPHKEDVVWTAWRRFAEYDLNSSRHRDKWRRLKNWPLYLGVFST